MSNRDHLLCLLLAAVGVFAGLVASVDAAKSLAPHRGRPVRPTAAMVGPAGSGEGSAADSAISDITPAPRRVQWTP